MFCAKTLPLLVLVFAVCGASQQRNNGTDRARGRSFGLFPRREKVSEQIPREFMYEDDDGSAKVNDSAAARLQNHSAAAWPFNGTDFDEGGLSEEALLFLTGPISTILIPSFYTLVCIISVPINAGAVLAFSRGIRPKKAAAIFMLNLACADLVFAVLLPFKISYHFGGNNWIFGALTCRVVTAAFYWNMYCSVLLIACISVDRLLAVVYPIDSLAWRRPRNAVIACAAMWIVSLAGSVPLVLTEQTQQLEQLNITTCHDVQHVDEMIAHQRIYFLALCCALFFLPLLVILVSYTRVIWSLSRVPRGVPGRSRRRTRAVVMALTVLVMFVLCFTPTNCLLLAHYMQINEGVQQVGQSPDGSYAAYLVFMCLGSLSCLLDPLVYYFGSSQCQRQLSSALRCEKIEEKSRISHSSSDSYRSSSRAILKSSRTEISKVNPSDCLEKSLNSQYKKLLV